MKVVEIFKSIQGEGINQGRPAIFVRFAGCNLSCRHCDTKYSWKEKAPDVSIDKIVAEVKKYTNILLVVFTGGEPLIQKDTDLFSLINKIKNLKKEVAIETNCTVFNKNIPYMVDLLTLSPKLKSFAEGVDETEWNSNLSYYLNTYLTNKNLEIKFVVCNHKDYLQIKKTLKTHKRIKEFEVPVILQPNGITNTTNDYLKEYESLITKVINDTFWKGYRNVKVLMQNHRIVWGSKRGV